MGKVILIICSLTFLIIMYLIILVKSCVSELHLIDQTLCGSDSECKAIVVEMNSIIIECIPGAISKGDCTELSGRMEEALEMCFNNDTCNYYILDTYDLSS